MSAHPKAPRSVLLSTVDEVEAQFYEALQQADLERLMALWSDDDEVVCVHPGGPRVVGRSAVRASFEQIFARGPIPVVPEKAHRIEGEDCAVHSVLERVAVHTGEGRQTAAVLATNVYLRTPLGWRLVAHHASAAAPRELHDPGDAPATLH